MTRGNDSKLKVAKLERERLYRKSRHDLKPFIQSTFADYEFNWHHQLMIDKINQFTNGDIKKLMFYVPPQHGKSELVSRRTPAYALGKNPNLRLAFCTYNASFAGKFNREVQRIIDSSAYKRIFPDTRLNGSNVRDAAKGSFIRNTDEFEIVDKKGSYKSVGIGGALTGSPVDMGIIDDPIKDAMEANSETYRQRLWDWYLTVFSTRLHNDSQQMITLTRWHHDDLAGRILKEEPDDWTVITLPAIKEDNSNTEDPRKIGEALWESKHSAEKHLNLKSKSKTVFDSLLQQRPSAKGGNIFKAKWFIPYTEPIMDAPDFIIDSAYTEDVKNDRTAIMKCHIDEVGNKLWIETVIAVRFETPDLIEWLKDWLPANGYRNGSTVWVEPKANGKTIVQTFKKYTSFNFEEGDPPVDSKEARARSYSPFVSSRNIYYKEGEWTKEFFEEVEAFPNFKTDDMVDVLLYGIQKVGTEEESMTDWVGLMK